MARTTIKQLEEQAARLTDISGVIHVVKRLVLHVMPRYGAANAVSPVGLSATGLSKFMAAYELGLKTANKRPLLVVLLKHHLFGIYSTEKEAEAAIKAGIESHRYDRDDYDVAQASVR